MSKPAELSEPTSQVKNEETKNAATKDDASSARAEMEPEVEKRSSPRLTKGDHNKQDSNESIADEAQDPGNNKKRRL